MDAIIKSKRVLYYKLKVVFLFLQSALGELVWKFIKIKENNFLDFSHNESFVVNYLWPYGCYYKVNKMFS